MYGMKKTNIKKKPAKGKKQYKGFSKLPETVQRKINKKCACLLLAGLYRST